MNLGLINWKDVQDRLDHVMSRYHLTASALAKASGLSETVIHKIRIQGGSVRNSTIASICDALRIKIEWLMYGDGDIPEPEDWLGLYNVKEDEGEAEEIKGGEDPFIKAIRPVMNALNCSAPDAAFVLLEGHKHVNTRFSTPTAKAGDSLDLTLVNWEDVSDRLTDYLSAINMTGRRLAVASSLSTSAIYKITKRAENVRGSTILQICEALDIAPNWLLYGDEDDEPAILQEESVQVAERELSPCCTQLIDPCSNPVTGNEASGLRKTNDDPLLGGIWIHGQKLDREHEALAMANYPGVIPFIVEAGKNAGIVIRERYLTHDDPHSEKDNLLIFSGISCRLIQQLLEANVKHLARRGDVKFGETGLGNGPAKAVGKIVHKEPSFGGEVYTVPETHCTGNPTPTLSEARKPTGPDLPGSGNHNQTTP